MLREVIIVGMSSNKKPENSITLFCTYNPIRFIYPCRIPGFFFVNALKTEAWMIGIFFKKVIGVDSLFFYI